MILYKILNNDLNNNRFRRDHYGICFSNNMIGGRKCTMTWHVGDLEILHMNTYVISWITVYLKIK